MDAQNVIVPYPYLVTGLTMVALEVIAAFLGNGFIVVVNILDWWKNKRLNLTDHILVLLALSNAGLSYIYGNYIYFTFTWPQFILEVYAFPVTFAILLLMTLTSSWLIAWLCLFFCFKLVHFNCSFLVKLKRSINSAMVWFIVISEVIAISCSIPVIWSLPTPHNATTAQSDSQTFYSKFNNLYFIVALGSSSLLASLIVIVSLVCIIWSLCRHTYRMKKRIAPQDDSLLKTHKSAAKTILSLLLIYVVFCISVVLISAVIPSNDYGILYWLTVWMLMSISPALSVVLILGNSKLWLALQKMWP